jgi:hypothetical protein
VNGGGGRKGGGTEGGGRMGVAGREWTERSGRMEWIEG